MQIPSASEPELRRVLGRGGLLRLAYRLGRHAASGVLTLQAPSTRADFLVLRRGAVVCADGDAAGRAVIARLARLAAEPSLDAAFAGVAAYPPGAAHQVGLAAWARSHAEAQLDGALAERLVQELSGIRLVLRTALSPSQLDEDDRRMLAALQVPRRLDQIWPLARTPRFRLLAFLHFLRVVGAVGTDTSAADTRAADTRATGARATGARATGARATATRATATRVIDATAAHEHSRSPIHDPPIGAPRRHGPAPGPAASAASPSTPGAPSTPALLDPRRRSAMQLLGIDDAGDVDAIKRAYHRLARALHPDLQPGADEQRRRVLERRFAEVTAAYESLSR